MKEIVFVTSNRSKFEWAKERLEPFGIKIVHCNLELPEIRDFNVEKVASAKAKQAYQILKKPLLVEDRGFYVEALNGFPGPYINLMHKTIGIKGLLKLMIGEKNRKATFISVLAYIPSGDEIKLFREVEEGFVLDKIIDGDCRGWGDIMKIYGHEAFPEKALSQLSDKEWRDYQKIISERDYLSQFYLWLKDRL